MPILYEEFSFSSRVVDTSLTLKVFLSQLFECPICHKTFETYEEYKQHMESSHPLQWYFWYAPYGKPLLAFTGVAATGVILAIAGKAFAKR